MSDETTPGSDEAIKKGCICPILDNSHGRGFMGIAGHFVVMVGCPLHSRATATAPDAGAGAK